MVAGSQLGQLGARGAGWAGPLARAWRRPAALAWRVGPACIGLYLLGALFLLAPGLFGAHPPWAYNWEGYTAWRWTTYWEAPAGPLVEIWAPTDGLMTDSGQGPLVGLPVALGAAVAGVGIAAMRVPVTLVAALAIPLLWLLGRRLYGPGPATLAALLLAISPAFLFYGRTATLVGVSLAPLLLTALALLRVLDAPPQAGWRWRREGALAGALLLGIYAYAPVRLLWPLAILLLGMAAWRGGARQRVLLRAIVLCAVAVPLAVMALERLAGPDPEPVAAAALYFHARGEQVVALREDPAEIGDYLRDVSGGEVASAEAIARLVGQNAADLTGLLLDRDTGPVPVDYWNEHGRFWPWFLLPCALIGAGWALRAGRRGNTVALLTPLILTAGLSLPLLLTSRVHVGRLLPALPFALLLAAAGIWASAGWLAAAARRLGWAEAGRWAAPLLAGVLLAPAAVAARAEMMTPLAPTREASTAAVLVEWGEAARERGSAVLVEPPDLGEDIERVHAATYRLDLDGLYRFVDLQAQRGEEEARADPRPALLWRGALGALAAGEIAHPCDRLWFVSPEIAPEFFTTWRGAGCSGAPDSVILP